jgi:hypothetical protein
MEHNELNFLIDKLTRSIENIVTGDSFATEISLINKSDLKNVSTKTDWQFNWQSEFLLKQREIYKLTIVNNPKVIQGLISLQVKEDHVFMHLLENAPFNKGASKMYAGVAGNLVAFACKVSFQRGHDGNVAFVSKTQLIDHYIKTLQAQLIGTRLMVIDSIAAVKLIDRYFHNE